MKAMTMGQKKKKSPNKTASKFYEDLTDYPTSSR